MSSSTCSGEVPGWGLQIKLTPFENTLYHLLYSWASKFMLLRSACPDILIWSPASPPCQPSGWTHRHLWTRTPRWPGCVLFHLNYTNMNRWAHSEVCVHCCFCSEPPAEYENGTTDDLSPPPVVNGTTPQTEENGSNGLSGRTQHAKCGCPTYGQWKLMPFNFYKYKKWCWKNFTKTHSSTPF